MKKKLNNIYFKVGLTVFLVVAASILFYYLIFHGSNFKDNLGILTDILMPVIFGLGMGYLLTPVLNFLETQVLTPLCNLCGLRESRFRKKLIRGVGILLTTLLFFLLIYSIIAMLLSQIVPSIQSIVANFDVYLNNMTAWLNNLLANNPEIRDYALQVVNQYSGELEDWINNLVMVIARSSDLIFRLSMSIINMLKVFWNFILGFIISIYVLSSKECFAGQAKKIVYALFERDTANIIINDFRFIHKTFIGFVGGKILDSIIIGIICFVCTTIMNTPYAALVSVIIGVTNIIPFFGPFLGAIPSTILIFVVDPGHPLNSLYFVIFILILQQFDGNILGPKILGNSTGISGFWVIFSITLFGGLFGVLGMIIGVPFFAVIYASVKSIINSILRKKNMPMSTADYFDVGLIDEEGFHPYTPDSKISLKEKKQLQEAHYPCFGERMYSSVDDIRTDTAYYEQKRKSWATKNETTKNKAAENRASESRTSESRTSESRAPESEKTGKGRNGKQGG